MITKDMLLGEVLSSENGDKIGEILFANGMHCFGCPASQMESLEEACAVHGLNCDDIINQLNAAISVNA